MYSASTNLSSPPKHIHDAETALVTGSISKALSNAAFSFMSVSTRFAGAALISAETEILPKCFLHASNPHCSETE